MAFRTPSDRVPTRLEMVSAPASGREELEYFVRDCFAQVWGAQIDEFLPWLAGLRNDEGCLLGVLGMRPAESGPLFLEQYLPLPVEELVSQAAGYAVPRNGIVEVGNLATTAPGGARWLITALTAYLFAAGRDWVVFTSGPGLINAFHRLGLKPRTLAAADPARLGANASRWGRYYEQNPMVMAGPIEEGYRRLSTLFGAECALHGLWVAASRIGAQGKVNAWC